MGSGSIVNVASIAGLAGVSHRSAYNASKHGLIGLTRTLAAEWGGRGVRPSLTWPMASRVRSSTALRSRSTAGGWPMPAGIRCGCVPDRH